MQWFLSFFKKDIYLAALGLGYVMWDLSLQCIDSSCGVRPPECTDFSSCGTRALPWRTGSIEHSWTSVVIVHGLSCSTAGVWDLSSPSRDRTCIPCIARWILNQCTTREVPGSGSFVGWRLMLLNCGVKDSWESLGLQGDQTSQS